MSVTQPTIAAIATAPGRGGVGVIRLSGKNLLPLAQTLSGGKTPKPRTALYTDFLGGDGQPIDNGILLYFAAPASFTGEDVIELQGHGGPVVMDMLLSRCLELGARMAEPGEFTKRAFLNNKLDLAQAESVADLIDASSKSAARMALRSLKGAFSQHIHELVDEPYHPADAGRSHVRLPRRRYRLSRSRRRTRQAPSLQGRLKPSSPARNKARFCAKV